MIEPKIVSYEVKLSRTEKKIPIVNGVHLHSIYNPEKESELFIQNHLKALESKNEVLVLGLGFGYHINALIDKLTNLYSENFKIVIIEPNLDVYKDCMNLVDLSSKNLLIYPGFSPQELYSDLELIHFLLKKPAIMAHPSSFNLYQTYFKEILSFEAPKKIKDVIKFVNTSEVKEYLQSFNQEFTFEQIFDKDFPEKNYFSELDYLTLALNEITNIT